MPRASSSFQPAGRSSFVTGVRKLFQCSGARRMPSGSSSRRDWAASSFSRSGRLQTLPDSKCR